MSHKILKHSHTLHSHTWWTFLKMCKQMKTTSSCTDWHPQTSWEVFIGPSSNLIMLSFDDETLPILYINSLRPSVRPTTVSRFNGSAEPARTIGFGPDSRIPKTGPAREKLSTGLWTGPALRPTGPGMIFTKSVRFRPTRPSMSSARDERLQRAWRSGRPGPEWSRSRNSIEVPRWKV
jgi:hypothetical protein